MQYERGKGLELARAKRRQRLALRRKAIAERHWMETREDEREVIRGVMQWGA